jgi:hypothetical protein
MLTEEDIEKMTSEEKDKLLYMLLSNMAKGPNADEGLDWHREILDERERALAEGRATLIDWEDAKRDNPDLFE